MMDAAQQDADLEGAGAAGRAEAGRFDAVVIGGGIQGLTFAWEAARRGRRVALLEAGEFGSGSTAASMGIVHGGFRYWQDLDMGRLVRSRREQGWFLRAFPGLVRPLRCVLPFYPGDRAKRALFAAAAELDRGADVVLGRVMPDAAPGLPHPRLLGRRALLDLAPWLERQAVIGAGVWHDVEIVDYGALVEALLGRAAAEGVTCLRRTEVVRVLVGAGKAVTGVEAVERGPGTKAGTRAEMGTGLRFEAPVVVNCGGASLDRLARSGHASGPSFFRPLRAVNLHLEDGGTPLAAAFAIGAGKRLFVRPWSGGVLAGTFYEAGAAGQAGAADEVGRWLAALDEAAPGLGLRSRRVRRVMAGVVPVGADGATPAKRDVILDHGAAGGPRGLVSVSGVKLTTARWLSARAAAGIWGGEARLARAAGAQA